MSSHHPLFRFLTIVVLIVLVLSPLQPVAGAWPLERGEARLSAASQQPGSGVYRTTVTWRNPVMQRKLTELGVIILREESADSAIVLATAGQLEDLARLRFQPTQTDDAVELVQRQDASKAWLAPAVSRLAAGLGPEPDKAKTFDKAIEVTVEQRAGLASLNSLDDDGDGLTNTEEAWWCTDPLNPNSDGDAQGYSDGWVEYGTTPKLGRVAYDDRGEKVVSAVHQATLTGLSPETIIYYRLHSGNNIADNGGKPYETTTLASIALGAPVTVYGQVTARDGAPAVGAVVLGWLVNAPGNRSEPLSTLVDGWGYWVLSLPEVNCEQAKLHLEIVEPTGKTIELDRPACQ